MTAWIIILILSSILFSLVLHALQERKNKLKMQAELDEVNKQLESKDEFLRRRIEEVNEKGNFARDCYARAEKIAIGGHEMRKQSEEKIAVLEKQNDKLKQQLKNARENVKRRKKQLQESKNLKD